MAKTTRGGDGLSSVELDAAIADLQRKAAALEKLKRARSNLAEQERISRELLRKRREALAEAEREAEESGALKLLGVEPVA